MCRYGLKSWGYFFINPGSNCIWPIHDNGSQIQKSGVQIRSFNPGATQAHVSMGVHGSLQTLTFESNLLKY